ncbi:MAG TPA: PAS domain S-box protein [Pyrinomonadaceae bacterium]|jgi:PAS domain S-box-containing protein
MAEDFVSADNQNRQTFFHYASSAVVVGAALLLTKLLSPYIDETPLFFLAVLVSAWFGGIGTGLFAALLALLAVDFFFVPPLYELSVRLSNLPYVAVFAISAVFVSWLGATHKSSEETLKQSRDELDEKVRERTAELQKINDELREQAKLLDLTHDTIFVRDMNDVITFWNHGAAEAYGWTKNEAVGRVSHDLTQTNFPAPLAEINNQLLKTGRWEGEIVHTRRDGTQITVASRWALQYDSNGKPYSILETNNNITERKRAEEEVRKSEERYRALFEDAVDAIFISNIKGVYLDVNSSACRLLGYEREELIGKSVVELLPPEEVERFVSLRIPISQGKNQFGEWSIIRKDGVTIKVEVSSKMLPDGRFQAFMRDITERKNAEAALHESEARFRHVADTAPVLIWISDTTKQCTWFNKPWLEFTGKNLEEETGDGWTKGVHEEDFNYCLETYSSAFDKRKPFSMEYRLRRNDGEYRWLMDNGVPRFTQTGEFLGYIGSCVDITELKNVEAELRKNQERLELAHEAAKIAAFEWFPGEGRSAWQKEMQLLYGFQPGEYDGSYEMWLERVHPEDRQSADEAVRQTLVTGTQLLEFRVVWNDGTVRWIQSRGKAYFDEKGNPTRVVGINADITERKESEEELRRLQAELAHITRVMTMGALTSSIAHEVNQPLAAVVTNGNACLRWLAADPPNLEEARVAVNRIIRDGNRASEVIARTRALLKKSPLQKSPLDINEVVTETISLVRNEAQKKQILLRTNLTGEIPPLSGDKIQLQQVLLNLLINGIDSMKSPETTAGELLIETNKYEEDKIIVVVKDSGEGLSAENLGKVFEAFYTTKKEGIGMGLSISRSIIEAHGGKLWAEAGAEKGAIFKFTLPCGR